MRALVPILFLPGAAAASGLDCKLDYSCIADACESGEIDLRIEERDGKAGVVTIDEFYPIEKRTDPSGEVTYITPVDNGDIYFMTVLPDGRAMASGHSVPTFPQGAELVIYGATGRCAATE
jgi:hypothetical protein